MKRRWRQEKGKQGRGRRARQLQHQGDAHKPSHSNRQLRKGERGVKAKALRSSASVHALPQQRQRLHMKMRHRHHPSAHGVGR